METKKSHRKHFETKVKEIEDTIRKAEREHENMKKLVRVRMPLTTLIIPKFDPIETHELLPFYQLSGCDLVYFCFFY